MYEALKLFHGVGTKILWLFEHTGVKHLDDVCLEMLNQLSRHLDTIKASHEAKNVR